jgi:putative DNA primase/helicase
MRRSENGRAALELAAAGHPILPLHSPTPSGCSCGRSCGRVGKHPRGVYGLKHATTDLEQLETWWFGQPEANVGMRCDGLVVLDVDGPEGRRSLEQLEWELGELPASRLQISGRGEHRFYSTPEVDSIGNSTAPLGSPPGLDLRAGNRGYVVAAPSRHESGVRYQWLDPERPIEPLPLPWVERLLLPKPVELGVEAVACTESSAYGRAALRRELATLAQVQPGNRNNALNCSVYALAGWVSGGELDCYELHNAAREAGLALGLPHDEVERTICSAMNAGYARARWKH